MFITYVFSSGFGSAWTAGQLVERSFFHLCHGSYQNSFHQPNLSLSKYYLTDAELQPKTPFISFSLNSPGTIFRQPCLIFYVVQNFFQPTYMQKIQILYFTIIMLRLHTNFLNCHKNNSLIRFDNSSCHISINQLHRN